MKIDIGLDETARNKVADGLKTLLADSYALYLKSHNYHWNVTGPLFKAVHELTEDQYKGLASAIDEIAERIRMLGVKAPGSFSAFKKLTSIGDADENLNATDMLADLVKSHETVIKTARALLPIALIDERLAAHEKQAWMLRSLLDK